MFLFRRRPELRKLGTEADVNSSTAAVNYSTATETLIKNLVEDGERYRKLTETIQTTVERLQREAIESQRECTRQLDVAHGENLRLVTRVAQLNTDLDIAHRQISDMSARFPHDPMTREV
jgi:multidrug resistance efflux pump